VELEDVDGHLLLTSAQAEPLLRTAIQHAGGELVNWQLDQVDRNPGHSTIVTYIASVNWPYGRRNEVLGAVARVEGPNAADTQAEIFADGDRQVAVWMYPQDPDLPGLARAAYPESMAEICNANRVFVGLVTPDDLKLTMVGYRPRRRAVLRVAHRRTGEVVYVKVLRAHLAPQIVEGHQLLLDAGLPVAKIRGVTEDHLLILAQLNGTPLAEAIFAPQPPCSAEALLELLDRLPPAVADLPRRTPWADSLNHYAEIVQASCPGLAPRLEWLVPTIQDGLAHCRLGDEPTHGDFHEGQLQVREGRIVGMVDVDTVGPGRRADDLACLVAHLSTIQHMNDSQTEWVHRLIRTWVPVFDRQVDPAELRLRAAAVIVSLATGPFRSQEPAWERETALMIGSAEALVRQVA
jgi:hypothetical protein